MATDATVIDHEDPSTEPSRALQLRRPDTPTTLNELAALKSDAIEVIEARVEILATLRKASLRATQPEDWVLFKAPDEQGGQIVGYLQDAGCDRVRDFWGINVYNISKPEKITTNDPKVFTYVITGDGRCTITRQVVEQMEGGRSSTDDFCKGKDGADLELTVRKAARANLDGNITRELASLKSVPLDEIKAAWEGTTRDAARCRRGRGFGTRDERVGGASAKAPDVEPPVCPHCNSKGVYRPAKDNRKAFYGCPNYGKHANQKFIIDAEKWVAEQQAKAAQPAAAAASQKVTPPTAEEVFGNASQRQPGEEG